MREMVMRCDRCKKVVDHSSDIYLLRMRNLGTTPDLAGGHSEHDWIQHELCSECAKSIEKLVEFITARVK